MQHTLIPNTYIGRYVIGRLYVLNSNEEESLQGVRHMIKVTREETSDFSWWLNITSVARLCIGKKKQVCLTGHKKKETFSQQIKIIHNNVQKKKKIFFFFDSDLRFLVSQSITFIAVFVRAISVKNFFKGLFLKRLGGIYFKDDDVTSNLLLSCPNPFFLQYYDHDFDKL